MSAVLKSSLLNMAATGVSLVAGFGVSLVVARLLGPEGSGLVAFAIWLATSLAALSDRGMPQTMLRSLATFGDDDEEGWKGLARAGFARFIRTVTASLLAVLAYAVWVAASAGLDSAAYWIATALLFILYALYVFSTAAARGRGRFAEASLGTVTGSLLQLPLVVLGAWWFGIAGAVTAVAARYLPQALKLPCYISQPRRADDRVLTPDMRRYARHIWISDIIDVVIMTRVELLLLGLMLTPADMGYFAVAGVFASLVGQFAIQLSSPLVVGFADPRQDNASRDAFYGKSLRIMALIVLPVGLGGAAIAPALVPLVFGTDFAPASLSAFLLMVAAGFSGIVVVPWAYLAATGHSEKLLRAMIAVSLATIALFIATILLGGVNGAAIARVLVEFLSLGTLFFAVSRAGGPPVPFPALFKVTLAAGFCGSVAWICVEAIGGWAGIAAGITAGVFTYVAAVRGLRLIPADDLEPIIAGEAFKRLPPSLQRALAMLAKALAASRGR